MEKNGKMLHHRILNILREVTERHLLSQRLQSVIKSGMHILQNFLEHQFRIMVAIMVEMGGSGDDADAELTATAAASEKDAGSKSKSAVSTADESPIGTMSVLAALSLLAGGYVVVRKRKKEEI